MGGDSRTVKVTNTGGTPGRRLLIVKDSYGNAVASNLFGSFEEVHVADFRYYPHSLIDYIRDNKITDFVIANCISLAFAPNTTARYETMLRGKKSSAPLRRVPTITMPTTKRTTKTTTETNDNKRTERQHIYAG